MNNLRVLHLLKTSIGGTWALLQVRELVALGTSVHVALPDGPMVKRFIHAGAIIHLIQTDIAGHRPWAWSRLFADLQRLVKEIAPDLIHSHFVGTTATMRMALATSDIPRVFQVPGPLHLEHQLFAHAELALATSVDHWIAACRWTQDAYRRFGISDRRLFLSYYATDLNSFIPNSTDHSLRRILGLSNHTMIAGMVAYIYPPKRFLGQRRGLKGHEDFIDAIALCRRQGVDVVGVVVGGVWGNAQWYEQVVHAYATRHCPGGIHFLGSRNDICDLYPSFNVAVHPSLSENVGGAAESSLMVIPTIATNVGGFPDLVIPGQTGWLVPPSSPRHLAQTITEVLANPTTARRFAENARAKALVQFSPQRLGQEIHDIYHTILGRHS